MAFLLANCSAKAPAIDPKFGVAASPLVIEPGDAIPKGGGREQVGKPYQVAGKTYEPTANFDKYSVEGLASWYGSAFHGRMTANGEVFDMGALSAAHPTMPLPSYARVTNVNNGRSIVVRVNDRGPFHGERAMDVSQRVAEVLDFKNRGMAKVRIDYVGPASLKGSDDGKLLATYREKGETAPHSALALASHPAPPASAMPSATKAAVASVTVPKPIGPETPLRGAVEPHSVALADATPPATTPVDINARIASGFSGMTSPQPLTQPRPGALVEPVLSGFAFSPALSAPR